MPAKNGVMRLVALMWMNEGPNGIPRPIVGYSAAMLKKIRIWTSSGVPRKNQM